MGIYKGKKCSICEKIFEKDETVVVCPHCGAPSHRECFDRLGDCRFEDQHSPDFNYIDVFKDEAVTNPLPVNVCSHCGAENEASALFCQSCGVPSGSLNRTQAAGPGIIWQQTFNSEEEIDGIKTRFFSAFIGSRAYYFLSFFKIFASAKKFFMNLSINLSAFLFHGYYLIYRKMYALGIITLLVQTLLNIPISMITIHELKGTDLHPMLLSFIDSFPVPSEFLISVSVVSRVLLTALRTAIAFLANRLYFKFSKDQILKAKKVCDDDRQLEQVLSKKGNVTSVPVMAVSVAACYLFTSLILALALMFI